MVLVPERIQTRLPAGLSDFFRWCISNLVARMLLKRAKGVSTILTKECLKNTGATPFFFESCMVSVGFLSFPITIPNQKRGRE